MLGSELTLPSGPRNPTMQMSSARRAWPNVIPVLMLLIALFALFTGDQTRFWIGIVGALGALAWLALRGAAPVRTMYNSLLVYATLIWLGSVGFAVFAAMKSIEIMSHDPPLTTISGVLLIVLTWTFPILFGRLLFRAIQARPDRPQRA